MVGARSRILASLSTALGGMSGYGEGEGVRAVVARIVGRHSIRRSVAADESILLGQQRSRYLGSLVPVNDDIGHMAATRTMINIIGLIDCVRRSRAIGW